MAKFSDWLIARGMPPITIVKAKGATLEQDCINRKTLPSVAFGFKTCSQRWKVQPQDSFLNKWPVAKEKWRLGGKVVKLIGYDAGELRRAKDFDSGKYIVSYPLIEWGWDRKKCQEVVASEGFNPRKSSCFFCPNMRRHEVIELSKTHPDLATRAVQMEQNADQVETVAGLGRSYSWTALIENEKNQLKFGFGDDFTEPMPCGCYDGESACPVKSAD